MWSSCLTSCISFAKNIGNDEGYEFHSKCKEWAAEGMNLQIMQELREINPTTIVILKMSGECEANPNFIHVHCPAECGLSVAWDPFTRRELQFDELPFETSLSQDNCGDNVSDVISAAEVIKVS